MTPSLQRRGGMNAERSTSMSTNQSPRDAPIQRVGRAKYEEWQRAASEEWDGVSVDIEPLPAWIAVLAVLALLGIFAGVVWAAVWRVG